MSDDLLDLEVADDVAERLRSLGPPIARFGVSQARVIFLSVAGVLLLLIGLFLVGACIVVIVMGFKNGRFGGGAVHGIIYLSIIGVSMIIGGITLPRRALRNRSLYVLVYPEGLVRIQGYEVQTLYWDEVILFQQLSTSDLKKGLVQGGERFQLRSRDGKLFEFDNSLGNLKELGAILREETLPILLPRALETLQSGQSLNFDKFRIALDGIRKEGDNDVLSWDMVKSADIKFPNQFQILKHGGWTPWLNVPVADVPNVHVAQAVVEHVLTSRGWRTEEASQPRAQE